MKESKGSSQKGIFIAIDGPVASGKGTIAPLLAQRLHGFHLYTGAMYRALALYCREHDVDMTNEQAIRDVLSSITIELLPTKTMLNGKEVSDSIKTQDIAQGASLVGVFASVRQTLVQRQREIAERSIQEGKVVVAEGRDTGTVVFPNADLKIYLTAKVEVRAKRRLEQLHQQGNNTITFEMVLEDTKIRDNRDTERVISPLVNNPKEYGYFILDNSDLNEEETIQIIIEELKRRRLLND